MAKFPKVLEPLEDLSSCHQVHYKPFLPLHLAFPSRPHSAWGGVVPVGLGGEAPGSSGGTPGLPKLRIGDLATDRKGGREQGPCAFPGGHAYCWPALYHVGSGTRVRGQMTPLTRPLATHSSF